MDAVTEPDAGSKGWLSSEVETGETWTALESCSCHGCEWYRLPFSTTDTMGVEE